MTDNQELESLIAKMDLMGGTVDVTYCEEQMLRGSKVIDTVRIAGIKGCGPFPMSPIFAAEKMRDLVWKYNQTAKVKI